MKQPSSSHRYPEIDLARSAAVAMMIVYHAAFDLTVFYGYDIPVFDGGWKILQRATAILFLILVGVSFAISWDRSGSPQKYLRRGLILIGCGFVVSAVTYVVDPQTFVRFGILHLIGLGMLLLPFFARAKEVNALIGILFIVIGDIVKNLWVTSPFLLPLGIIYPGFRSVDYFPLFPWFGVILMGVALGHFLYVRQISRRQALRTDRSPLIAFLSWPGRHALLIYLVHQPILLLILFLLH